MKIILRYKCSKCGILLGKTYPDTLCKSCREKQKALDEEARLAAGVHSMKPRSVIEIAGSFFISIPRQQADFMGITKGSKIVYQLTEDRNGLVLNLTKNTDDRIASVPFVKSSCDQDPDRNAEHKIIVIDGLKVIQLLDSEYGIEHLAWERACAQIRGSFRQKTSRSNKNGKEYESTRWYQILPGGGMKSTGSAEEPDYKTFYSPEPKPRYGFTILVLENRLHDHEHIVMEEKDYRENEKLFKDCLVFELKDCLNYLHPLYKNPNKNLSVRVPVAAGSSGRDRINSIQKTPEISTVRKDGISPLCFNNYDCDNCEHNQNCPVKAEEDEEEDPEFPNDEETEEK